MRVLWLWVNCCPTCHSALKQDKTTAEAGLELPCLKSRNALTGDLAHPEPLLVGFCPGNPTQEYQMQNDSSAEISDLQVNGSRGKRGVKMWLHRSAGRPSVIFMSVMEKGGFCLLGQWWYELVWAGSMPVTGSGRVMFASRTGIVLIRVIYSGVNHQAAEKGSNSPKSF